MSVNMPKSPDKSKATEADSTELAFEDALGQLEELVREMESDQMPLEDLIGHYERGSSLYRVCEKRLNEAHGRIEIIRKKQNGETVLEPFGDENAPKNKESKTTEKPSTADAGDQETDGELF